MGCYTTIHDKKRKLSLQIKTGWDSCEHYSLGDRVDFVADTKDSVGCLYDGAYKAECEPWWIIIKDHKVHAIVPAQKLALNAIFEDRLIKKYKLKTREQEHERAWLRPLAEPLYDLEFACYKVVVELEVSVVSGQPLTPKMVAEKIRGDPRFVKMTASKIAEF